ncbi:MAG: hypothetical protein PF689_10215 [Deltaproteobacteria bacterium]|jgi:hypothetical protein|nr:hypothetical protein [Deltaproteobacteria bacterium]
MESVEVREFQKIMKGELGTAEDLKKIKGFLKKIHGEHGKFELIDTLENKKFLIDVEVGKVTWKEAK